MAVDRAAQLRRIADRKAAQPLPATPINRIPATFQIPSWRIPATAGASNADRPTGAVLPWDAPPWVEGPRQPKPASESGDESDGLSTGQMVLIGVGIFVALSAFGAYRVATTPLRLGQNLLKQVGDSIEAFGKSVSRAL